MIAILLRVLIGCVSVFAISIGSIRLITFNASHFADVRTNIDLINADCTQPPCVIGINTQTTTTAVIELLRHHPWIDTITSMEGFVVLNSQIGNGRPSRPYIVWTWSEEAPIILRDAPRLQTDGQRSRVELITLPTNLTLADLWLLDQPFSLHQVGGYIVVDYGDFIARVPLKCGDIWSQPVDFVISSETGRGEEIQPADLPRIACSPISNRP